MPETSAAAERVVLDRLVQPVFFVHGETVTHCNRAGAALIGPAPVPLTSLLTVQMLDCYRRFDGQGTLAMPIRLGDGVYGSTVSREPDCDLIVASDRPLRTDGESDVLLSVSRAMRRTLNELFSAASVLFPQLEELESPQIQRETARINQELYSLLRLASNLSDSRGQTRPLLEKTELGLFLQNLRDHAAPLCETLDAELVFCRPKRPIYAAVDRQKVERAVLNLISNSLRAIDRGGRIELRLSEVGANSMVQVIDNGCGMSAEQLSHVFEQYDPPERLTEPDRGVGLGLPLIRSIAMLHGGTAMVSSVPGRGTTVMLILSRTLDPSTPEELRSPMRSFDYAGDRDHALLELSDVLPPDTFDTRDVH